MSRSNWSALSDDARVQAEGQLRLALVQAGVALVAGLALWYTSRNYRLSVRGQVTDRFTKALERLDSGRLYVRLGGILGLEQIVHDAPGQAAHAAKVLTAFIREHAPRRVSLLTGELAAGLPSAPSLDVEAALTALTSPASRRHVDWDDPRIEFQGLHLKGALLVGADLTGIWFCDIDLSEARLAGAIFNKTVFLGDSSLSGADLRGADLSGALGVMPEHVLAARIDHETRLPAYFYERPGMKEALARKIETEEEF